MGGSRVLQRVLMRLVVSGKRRLRELGQAGDAEVAEAHWALRRSVFMGRPLVYQDDAFLHLPKAALQVGVATAGEGFLKGATFVGAQPWDAAAYQAWLLKAVVRAPGLRTGATLVVPAVPVPVVDQLRKVLLMDAAAERKSLAVLQLPPPADFLSPAALVLGALAEAAAKLAPGAPAKLGSFWLGEKLRLEAGRLEALGIVAEARELVVEAERKAFFALMLRMGRVAFVEDLSAFQ